MSLTQAEIALIVREIEPLCGRSSLQRVLEPAARLLVLQLRQPGATRHLLVSTETDATRLHFLADKPDQPGHPSAFAMLLRKWLHGAALLEVEQVRGDRVVDFTFETVDPRVERPEADDQPPDRIEAHLICELAGRVGNVFLTDGERRIVGRQTDEAIGGRSFERGEVWTPPPAPPDNGIGEEVRPLLRQADPDDEAFAHSRQLERAYRERTEEERRDDLASRIDSGLSRTIDRLDRRADHVEEDLEQVEDAGTYKRWAELLQSAYGEVERGDESVQVPDYYQDEMPKVEIPLDPAKSLQENIDHYFHEAHRYEEAREMVEERLLETLDRREEAGEELDAFRRQADDMDLPQLEALAERLRADGLLPKPKSPSNTSSSGRANQKKKPYREFRATSGRKILVGRGPSENDTLSTKIARGRDYWFHTRDFPGAHVVLRLENRDESPQNEDLLDAATLAAHFSQGSNDTVVDVSYTRAKHVRKTGNLPPGQVFVANDKNIAVRLEDERLERLMETEVI
jgi:predicted ribosome quality control (RQC) complex YloA/Tae2 family protein